MLFLLDDLGLLLVTLITLLILFAVPLRALSAMGVIPRAGIAALARAAAIWFAGLLSAAVVWGVAGGTGNVSGSFSPTALVVGVALTTVLARRGAYKSGWLGWILLFALGPVGSIVLLWHGGTGEATTAGAPDPTAVPAAAIERNVERTTTLDMTPEVRSALAGRRWIWRAMALGGAVILTVAYLVFTRPDVEEGAGVLALFLGLPIGFLLLVLAVLMGELPIDRDLASGSYQRTSGTVRLELHQFRQGRNQLWVGDHDFSACVRDRNGPFVLLDWRTVQWVTIDYSLKSQIVLSVRDATGLLRYAMRGYQP